MDTSRDKYSASIGYGQRPNKFICIFPILQGGDATLTEKVSYTFLSAGTPERNLGVVKIKWLGRDINLPGDIKLSDFGGEFLADAEGKAKHYTESWANLACDLITNKRAPLSQVKRNVELILLDENDNPKEKYTLTGAFPINIGSMQLNVESEDQIGRFSAGWAYDNYSVQTIS